MACRLLTCRGLPAQGDSRNVRMLRCTARFCSTVARTPLVLCLCFKISQRDGVGAASDKPLENPRAALNQGCPTPEACPSQCHLRTGDCYKMPRHTLAGLLPRILSSTLPSKHAGVHGQWSGGSGLEAVQVILIPCQQYCMRSHTERRKLSDGFNC